MSEIQEALEKRKTETELSLAETKEPDLIDKLQAEIQSIRDARCEERFIWSFAILMVFDIAVVAVIKDVPTSLIIFEFLFLWVLSTHLGVERIQLRLREIYEDLKKAYRYWIDRKYSSKKED